MPIVLQFMDFNAPSGQNAIAAAADTTYVVEQNVHVSSDVNGYRTFENNTELVNFGGVFSSGPAGAGALLAGGSAKLINADGAAIAGADGVRTASTGVVVTNLGSIAGLLHNGVELAFGDASIDNRGHVFGQEIGVFFHSADAGGSIVNTGSINSAQRRHRDPFRRQPDHLGHQQWNDCRA